MKPTQHLLTVPEQARRKLAQAYAQLASGRRFTPAERAEFARMADAWMQTVEKKSVK